MICAGIDAGSRAIKIVLADSRTLEVVACGTADQGVEQDALALGLFERVLKDSGIGREDVRRIVATGHARNGVSIADTTITEITCHACGVRHLVPDAMTIIEIGGQDSKLLRLSAKGRVRDFDMNDRCAAGAGRPATINPTCAVFAETEIIGLLAGGAAPEDIVAGVEASIAARVSAMTGRNVTPPVVFTGGVAMISSMADALQSALRCTVTVAPDPQMTGALGAAILASRGLAWQ